MSRISSVLTGLLAPFFVACTSQDVVPEQSQTQRWRDLKAEIRKRFDDVEHVTIDDYRERREPKMSILDVRAEPEFELSHLPGALSAPMGSDFTKVLSGVDKGDLVMVYCSVGWRSSIAAQQLRSLGYVNVVNLEGSIFEWANRELPLEGREGANGMVHPFDADWGKLVDEPHRAAIE